MPAPLISSQRTRIMSQPTPASKTFMQKILDVVEKVGNMVPHPAVIFLALIAVVIVLSAVFSGASVTTEVIEPVTNPTPEKSLDDYPYSPELSKHHQPVKKTTTVQSLLSTEGLRFIYVSVIPSFMSFTGLGLIIVAMIGVGVAEETGLV